MKLPLVCIEGHDICVFQSLEDAALKLELVDIYNNEYEFFDAEGYVVEAYVVGCNQKRKCKFLFFETYYIDHYSGEIKFRRKVPLELRRDELIRLLITSLNDRNQSIDTNNLDDLIKKFLFYSNWHFRIQFIIVN